jgi:DNA-binding response OmpR family regulator
LQSEAIISVLLVEDNPTDVLLTEEALTDSHFHIDSVERLDQALTLLASQRFNVVLLDLGLPDSQGLETLQALRAGNSHVAIVVLTGKDDDVLALRALQEGAQDYLAKGDIEAKSLKKTLQCALSA